MVKYKSSPNGRFTFWGMNSDLENTDGNVRNTSFEKKRGNDENTTEIVTAKPK